MGEGAGKNHFFRKKVLLCHYLGQVCGIMVKENGLSQRRNGYGGNWGNNCA